MMAKTPFEKGQVRSFVKEVKKEAGSAWGMLGQRFQHALIVERAAYVMAGQASETIEPDTISWLIHAMLVEAGLAEEK